MNCNCGEKCFSYQKFNSVEDERVISIINTCARIEKTNPKKKKCSFYSEVILSSVECKIPDIVEKIHVIKKKCDHKEELFKNITLYKNCIENGFNFKNFAARIDYHLDALNYKHFDYSNESVSELEKRIIKPPDRVKTFPGFKSNVVISHELLPSARKKRFQKRAALPKKQIVYTKPKTSVESYLDNLTTEEMKENEIKILNKEKIELEDQEEQDELEETELRDHLENNEDEQDNEEYNKYTGDNEKDDEEEDDGGDFSD
jgi:hypothetical protein